MVGFGKKKVAKKVAVEVENPNIDPIEKMLYEGTQRIKEIGLDDIEIRTPNSNI